MSIEKSKRLVSLVKQTQRIRDRDLRTHAHGACVSIRTRSRNKNSDAGQISNLEFKIYSRCEDVFLRYKELVISNGFLNQVERDEVTQVIGRLFKRSLTHTFRDELVQESLCSIISLFEKIAMISVSELPN